MLTCAAVLCGREQSAHLDRLSAERTALSVQLDDARAKMSSLERQLKVERERSSSSHRDDVELEAAFPSKHPSTTSSLNGEDGRSGHRSKSVAGRSVTQAVTALDRLGAMVGLLLRRHSYVRVGFAAYVFVIHLWAVFILFHLIGEMEGALSPPLAMPGTAGASQLMRSIRPSVDGLGNG